MRGSEFDELQSFAAIQSSRARALLIGRRALVLIGLPVLTADYDFWIAGNDIAAFNASCDAFGLRPTVDPAGARRRGLYVLENDEHVDVLVARSIPTTDGVEVHFDEVWNTLKRETERSLSAEDARAYLAAPVSAFERREVLALVEWFSRRYPTPLARLAYARTAYTRWRQTCGAPPR